MNASYSLMRRQLAVAGLVLMLAALPPRTALANADPSAASALSMLPVAVLVAAPVAIVSAGAALTVATVETSATGTVWVLERASDGARATLRLSGQAAGAASMAAGTAVVVTAMSAGMLVCAAGEVIAFIPNQLGQALLHNERITR